MKFWYCINIKQQSNLRRKVIFIVINCLSYLGTQLLMQINILLQPTTTRFAAGHFQHLVDTIHRHFKCVLKVIFYLSKDLIVPASFDEVAPELQLNPRYSHFFKVVIILFFIVIMIIVFIFLYLIFFILLQDCVGAIDGTHISTCILKDEQISYCGRKLEPTINVLCYCLFDMKFTFSMIG